MRIPKLLSALLFGASLASAAEKSASNAVVSSIAFNGTGEAFVYLTKTDGSVNGDLGSCLNSGWVYVPDSKILSVFLTAKSMGVTMGRVWVKDNDNSRVLQMVGFTPCMLLSAQM